MIELIGTWLLSYDSGFDVLRYLTVRTIGGTLTALLLSIFLEISPPAPLPKSPAASSVHARSFTF